MRKARTIGFAGLPDGDDFLSLLVLVTCFHDVSFLLMYCVNKKRVLPLSKTLYHWFLLAFFLLQVFWLSDRPDIISLPTKVIPSSGLSNHNDAGPRLQRRDRHGFSPCSGMQVN